MWEYAELSKTAKSFGGPKKYCNALVALGKKSMHPVVVAAGAGGLVVGAGGVVAVTKIRGILNHYKKKKSVSSRATKTKKHMKRLKIGQL